eukprot:TRINITY_DN1977_c0_g1_i1.p1 TRINITY_DN1977_c0_g1~~TRINITY_DN1977_c0_g1_i1.p1  ORF type:complete len:148 (-),score=43.80 TRINITY_DN1977_c0_g1_i1:663-1106(-)
MSSILFEDRFEVTEVDELRKHFSRVARIDAKGEISEMKMQLDINTELFQLSVNDYFDMALTRTLNPTGDSTRDETEFDQSGGPSLLDDTYGWEYVMYGKVYNFFEAKEEMVMLVSFGGLLMKLTGVPQLIGKFELDSRIYILLRKSQ